MTYFDATRTPAIRIIEVGATAHPAADSAHCSLMEAIQIAGRAKFGQAWTNEEIHAREWKIRPVLAASRSAVRIVKKPPPPERSIAGHSPRPTQFVPVELTEAEYAEHQTRLDAAIRDQQERWDLNHEAVIRLEWVVDWIAQQCRDALIRTCYRFKSGGLLAAMHASEWNVDDPLQHFVAKGGFERWFGPPSSRKFSVVVFLRRTDLTNAIATFPDVPLNLGDDSLAGVSPYLRFAVQLARQHGWTSAASCESKDVRAAVISAAWEDAMPGVPRTANQVELVAKITGYPNVSGINNGSKGRSSRNRGNT